MKKVIQPSKEMFKDVCDLIDSYGSIRAAAKELNFSPTFLSNIKRGLTAITPILAAKSGWFLKKNWMKE